MGNLYHATRRTRGYRTRRRGSNFETEPLRFET